MAGFLRRFLAPAEDPRRAFPDPERLAERALELRGRMAELDGRARRALAAGDRAGAWAAVSLHELAAAELEELEAAMRCLSLDEPPLPAQVNGAIDTFAVEMRLVSLESELRDPSRQRPPGG